MWLVELCSRWEFSPDKPFGTWINFQYCWKSPFLLELCFIHMCEFVIVTPMALESFIHAHLVGKPHLVDLFGIISVVSILYHLNELHGVG